MPDAPLPLQGCHVVSLRPVGQHRQMRGCAARAGARLIALSPWVLTPMTGADVAERLDAALGAPKLVFTSPAAVAVADTLRPLAGIGPRQWFAVGAGTARALRRAGIGEVRFPLRMDSEGLLALPGLIDVDDTAIGLVTAPEGRERIATGLSQRGGLIRRADVYRRQPASPRRSAVDRLLAACGPLLLPVSSGQALEQVLRTLPAPATARLRTATAVAASPRLAALAATHGFSPVVQAADARPRSLIEAMVAHISGTANPVA